MLSECVAGLRVVRRTQHALLARHSNDFSEVRPVQLSSSIPYKDFQAIRTEIVIGALWLYSSTEAG